MIFGSEAAKNRISIRLSLGHCLPERIDKVLYLRIGTYLGS